MRTNYNNRGHLPRIAVGTMILVLLLLAGGAGAATPISSCTTIATPGEYVLNQNIINSSEGTCIAIKSNDVVFDGAGYIIDGIDIYSTFGVFVYDSTTGLPNVTVKNVTVTDWDTGIKYESVVNGSITNNTANSNREWGIFLQSSHNIMLIGNIASNNSEGIELIDSTSNTLSGNNASKNDYNGIRLAFSGNANNTFIGNIVNSNQGGIILGAGIYGGSTYNILNGNIVSNNGIGIMLPSFSNDNVVYNNYFNNTNNFEINNSTNTWNTTKTPGTNLISGQYLGGNVWANPGGTGFSQTCADGNSDGICDSSYTLDSNNIDYLPLAFNAGSGGGGNGGGGGGINGQVAYGPMTWNASNFPAFSNEVLTVLQPDLSSSQRTINLDELFYNTTMQVIQYKVNEANSSNSVDRGLDVNGVKQGSGSPAGYYGKLRWFAQSYVALNGKPNKLARLIIEQGTSSSESKTLAVGETWDIGGGWTLTAQSVDAKAVPRLAWLVLSKDGVMKDDKVVSQGDVYTYTENIAGESNVPLFVTYVDSIISGATSDMVQLRYTWAISTDIIEIKPMDTYGVFMVVDDGSGYDHTIKLWNDVSPVSLSRNSTINLFDGLYFVVNDSPSLEYYPQMAVISNGGDKGFVDDVALLQSNGWWAVKYNFNSAANGTADKWFPFGDGTAKPVVGDFRHTGTPSDVTLLQSNGWWAIKYDFNNATNGSVDKWIAFGDGTAKPVVGDFDHDGFKDDVALLQSNGWWAIKYDFNSATNGASDKWIAFGDGTAKPVVGDFNGDGFSDDVALLQSNGWWALKYNFNSVTNGSADKWIAFGDGTAKPAVGDFDRSGTQNDVALLQSNGWWAIKYNFNSATNGTADKWIAFGDGTAKPVVGDFNDN